MPTDNCTISVKSFTEHPEVLECIKKQEEQFGKEHERLNVSDVLDHEGHQ